MKWKLDDIPVYVAVVETGGITAAADALRRPKSTVSSAIARLEEGLGLRLIERNSRNLRVTPEGDAFYRKARAILDHAEEADTLASGMSATPSGHLTVALPPAFAQEVVAPELHRFFAACPDVTVQIIVTGQGLGMLHDSVDIAVVVGPQTDSDLVCRMLAGGPLIWVASPTYLAAQGLVDGIEDIRPHIRICENRYGLARMPVHIGGVASHLDLSTGIAHVDDPLVVRRAVEGGAGISPLPARYCTRAITEGRLVQVCPHIRFDMAAGTLSAVYAGRRLIPPRVRAFADFLVEVTRDLRG